MAEFIKYSGFSSKFVSVRENVSSLQALLRLLCGCCSVAIRRHCCDCKGRVLRTVEQGGRGGPCKHMMDFTVVEISWVCYSASNLNLQV